MPPSPQPLTFKEFRCTAEKTLQLSLWFVHHWKSQHPEEQIPSILRHRVDIIRKTPLFTSSMNADAPPFDAIPGWLEKEQAITAIHQKCGDNTARFIADGLAVFLPLVEQALERQWRIFQDGPKMKCGSLTYHQPETAMPHVIAVHIANALAPHSIFDDPDYLARHLLTFMDQTEAEFGVTHIHCGSWLNSHPRWLAFFPEEYQQSLSAPDEDIQWHLGFWGQFINARGGFHQRNADQFRATGRLPFNFRTADCSFQALRGHLINQQRAVS